MKGDMAASAVSSALLLLISMSCLDVSHAIVPEKGYMEQQWAKYKTDYCKGYDSNVEEEYRRGIFEKTLKYIDKHNEEGHSYTLGINKFTDLTLDEFRAKMLGTIPPSRKVVKHRTRQGESDNPDCPKLGQVNIDESFSWVDKAVGDLKLNCISPVKNQGKCNSCWAFSTIGALESHRCIKHGEVVQLSVQQLVYNAETNNGTLCEPAVLNNEYRKIAIHDIATEEECPYVGSFVLPEKLTDKCMFGNETASSSCRSVGTIECFENPERSEPLMRQILFSEGPLSISYDAFSDATKQYKEGIIDLPMNCSTDPNHSVLLVGYATNTTSNVPYWIVKNSWDTDWGMNGYFHIRRGINMCGIEQYAYYPKMLECCM